MQDFQQFYDDNLLPALKVLEEKRESLVEKFPRFRPKQMKAIVILGILSFIFEVIAIHLLIKEMSVSGFIFTNLIGSPFYYGFWRVVRQPALDEEESNDEVYMDYKREFKTGIIEKIVHFIDKDLNYSMEGPGVGYAIMESKIFPVSPGICKVEDHIYGKIGKTGMEFSEVYLAREEDDPEQAVIQRETQKTEVSMFEGIFFAADFNKEFSSETVVSEEGLLGNKLGSLIQSQMQSQMTVPRELVKMEDPEFEKLFTVYSSDPIDARYILSPDMMARLTEFRKSRGIKVIISFVNSRMYILLFTKGWFAVPTYQSILDYGLVKGYFEDLKFMIGLVEQFNLNTRVWS